VSHECALARHDQHGRSRAVSPVPFLIAPSRCVLVTDLVTDLVTSRPRQVTPWRLLIRPVSLVAGGSGVRLGPLISLVARVRRRAAVVSVTSKLLLMLLSQPAECRCISGRRIFHWSSLSSSSVSAVFEAASWPRAPTAASGGRHGPPPRRRPRWGHRLRPGHTTSGTLLCRHGPTPGYPRTQVAAWAGHSVAVLLQIYAKCLAGQEDTARRRIAAALGES
jgi:hypothetical protein